MYISNLTITLEIVRLILFYRALIISVTCNIFQSAKYSQVLTAYALNSKAYIFLVIIYKLEILIFPPLQLHVYIVITVLL